MTNSGRKLRIAAVNSVNQGGETYLEYLRAVLKHLPADCEVDVFQTENTGLTKQEAENFLGRIVNPASYGAFPLIDEGGYTHFIGNDAYAARFVPESLRAIFISHGSAPMPASSDYMFSDWTSFWDCIIGASKGMTGMAARGMSSYRHARWSGKLNVPGAACRSDLRTTAFCPSTPLKFPGRVEEVAELEQRSDFTVGILPTSVTAIRQSAVLYNSLADIVPTILEHFPEARIVFRPYPADLENPACQKWFEPLRTIPRLLLDETGRSSAEFYEESDVLITDGSTGGVSYMLKRVIPPIYYIPEASLQDHIVSWFSDEINNKVLVAKTADELREKIIECRAMKAENRLAYYRNYCDGDLYLEKDKASYIEDALVGQLEEFKRVDRVGRIFDPVSGGLQ